MKRTPRLSLPDRIAATQDGLVARWQLLAAGMTRDAATWWSAGVRSVHDGVFLTGAAPITPHQRRRAATLTTPQTWLSHASAAAAWGLLRDPSWFVTVTRAGTSGILQYDGLHVSHSLSIADHVTVHEGVPLTTVGRTVIDLWIPLGTHAGEKLLREARRKRLADVETLLAACRSNRRRPGVAGVRRAVERRARLPFERCRSDAEAYALQVLDDASVPLPTVNETYAGKEADLCWPDLLLIIELDGPQWHRFKEEDAAKTAIWEAAGYRVRRLPTDELWRDPGSLLVLAPEPRPRRGRPRGGGGGGGGEGGGGGGAPGGTGGRGDLRGGAGGRGGSWGGAVDGARGSDAFFGRT